MGVSNRPIYDIRLLGAIAASLIALSMLSNLEPIKKLARSKVARGDFGVLVLSFAISPSSAQIATTDDAGRVKLRAPEQRWQIERFLDFPGYATDVAFSPDGRTLAAVGKADCVCLWDLTSLTSLPARAMVVPIQHLGHALFSPDGQSLAVTARLNGKILIWELATGRERMLFYHPSPVTAIAFSPDGRWLATGGNNDRSILLWDVHTGFPRVLVEGESRGHTRALAFSPDGALLASASFPDQNVRLWDLKTRRVCRILEGHTRTVTSIAFCPDGSLLATAGNDGMLGIWTVPTGQLRLSLDGQAMWFRAVAFSPDGRTLISATGTDDDIRSWDVAELLAALPRSDSSHMTSSNIQKIQYIDEM